MQTEAERYMDEAEKLLREVVENYPLLVVWRQFQEEPNGSSIVDTILVGMPDEDHPLRPTDLIVLSTWMDSFFPLVNICAEDGGCLSPFGGGHNPLEQLRRYAEKLQSL